MLQLLHFFLKQKYQITVASTASESDLSMNLAALGISKASIQLNHKSFDMFIKGLVPDVVLFDRFLTEEQFGWRVAEFAPNALRILDTEDLHSLRQTRESCFKKGIHFTPEAWLQADITKREIASIYRSDISLIISSYEMNLLKESIRIDETILMHLTFMLETITEKDIDGWTPFENRQDIVCMGNGRHAPNVDAVVWLKTEIWPLIRKQLPTINLKIYGAYLPEQVLQMHKPEEGFLIQGWAPNANEVLQQARVNLAPLRFGAGLKGKRIGTMQSGVPSVAAPIGAEGMHTDLEFNGSIAETSESIADAAVALYTNQYTWQKAQVTGVANINEVYDETTWREKLSAKITTVQGNLEGHRTRNYVGTILQHQTMASTKYMSKWIGAKNRQ